MKFKVGDVVSIRDDCPEMARSWDVEGVRTLQPRTRLTVDKDSDDEDTTLWVCYDGHKLVIDPECVQKVQDWDPRAKFVHRCQAAWMDLVVNGHNKEAVAWGLVIEAMFNNDGRQAVSLAKKYGLDQRLIDSIRRVFRLTEDSSPV